jgi:2-oxoglutarate dehydrogenase E2 component (dihydrolipoamide succinyltransferase)
MATEVTVPAFPESVTDGTVVAWRKQPGEPVRRGDILADIETDKVVFEVPATEDGVLQEVVVPIGKTVVSGEVIARIVQASEGSTSRTTPASPEQELQPVAAPPPVAAVITPSARKLIAEHSLDSGQIAGSGKDGRVLKEDVLRYLDVAPSGRVDERPKPSVPTTPAEVPSRIPEEQRPQRRVPMTRLRARIAERLVQAQRTAAILSTFNEVNMQPVMDLRAQYRERFEKEYGLRLGFMPFFVRASVEALKQFPEINASLDGADIVYHGFYDIGIAVSSPRGLVVPVLRDADLLDTAGVERQIKLFADKAQSGDLTLEDITGGTFTITNGGVFGSLLSTPILNPPQSAILGMHKIQPRPVAENKTVVVRPMMYLALSYDHRLVDGREAVQFLVTIKDLLEDPGRMLLGI